MEWSKEEITEFDRLIDDVSSQNQLSRISCGFAMQDFVNCHGKEKCDAMWIHLESGGPKEDKK
jgi:hypothetical protein